MEGVLDHGIGIVDGRGVSAIVKGDRIPMKRSPCPARKRLSDISNMQQQQQQQQSSTQDENPKRVSCTPKDYIEKLHKENATLLKLLADKNKIIELHGLELQKLRFNLQKVSQQNWQLAQTNSNMLAELNLGKDRLKGLQHELGCTMAALKAKNLQLEEKNKPCQKIGIKEEPLNLEEVEEAAKGEINSNRRRQSRRTSSSHHTQQVAVKDKVNNKRICLRRRSSACKSEQPKPMEDLFEIEDAKFPVHPLEDSMHEDCHISLDSCKPGIEKEKGNSTPQHQLQELRRSSIGRPLRKAAEKVNTYKEMPLNVKVRRSE
ncbi:SHUGOSHIN 1-like [Magnolia sinica]|uniref:SHUGOSHIN 1-like n=1 Tax=Magnolia sinica TaxID=86752 RepID=UPI002658B85C|nr:SHUGOSHIN 1-like [Magnolia sinica]